MPQVIDKVRKLLRLSTSPNVHEAALAAAKAQELIDRHQLAQVTLEMDTSAASVPDEPIQHFKDAPLDRADRRERWRIDLASSVARANQCRIWLVRGNIMIVGRPSDAETVRYLFGWLAPEVNRLAQSEGAGKGSSWRNNFRLGAVEAIRAQLKRQHLALVETLREEAGGNMAALVRVDRALAIVKERDAAVDTWFDAFCRRLGLGNSRGSSYNYDAAAREAGRRAGASLAIGKARRGLTAGVKRLPA